MRGSATGKLVDWANGEKMSKMTDQFGVADYSTFGALLVVRYGIVSRPQSRRWNKQTLGDKQFVKTINWSNF